jgi:two-component system sensor histidine kinase QseC
MTPLPSLQGHRPFSLTQRLLVSVLVTVTLLWVAAGIAIWWNANHEVAELVDKMMGQGQGLDKGRADHDRREILAGIVEGLLWPILLGLPIVAALLTAVIVRSLAPLKALSQSIAKREAGALHAITTSGLPSEILPLVQEVNGLFQRVGRGIALEKRFTADAAHELRTPIAVIRAQAQVAHMAVQDAERQHALDELTLACDRASHLIEQLLALSRLEGHGTAGQRTAFDLVALTRDTIIEVAVDGRHDWQLLGAGRVMVMQNQSLTGIVLRNLLDNARRYTPAGGTIEVTVGESPDGPTFTITDSGPGLSEQELARLGERFFRKNPGATQGSGLGWSIVRRIAEQEGLAVKTSMCPRLGGLRVTLLFKPPSLGVAAAPQYSGRGHETL